MSPEKPVDVIVREIKKGYAEVLLSLSKNANIQPSELKGISYEEFFMYLETQEDQIIKEKEQWEKQHSK